jgi:hypothetical protein
MASPNLIERSFELAAERCEDWSPEIDAAWRKMLDEIERIVQSNAGIRPPFRGSRINHRPRHVSSASQ